MIEIPVNKKSVNEVEELVKVVLDMLAGKPDHCGECHKGGAFLDWGVLGETYKNCNSQSVAEKVARLFKAKGYYVYYKPMGYGHRRIPEGTYVEICIQEKPHRFNNLVEF